MSTEAVAEERYPVLDALRGVAAFGVLFYHLKGIGQAGQEGWPIPTFASGYLAVDFFFVLSGFVICHAYAARLKDRMTVGNFMFARFVRLQPLIGVGTLIGFALALTQRANNMEGAPGLLAIVTALPANFLLLPAMWIPWGIFLFNPPAWSVFYELLANAVYALALRYRMGRISARNIARLRIWMPLTLCLGGYAGILATLYISGSLDRGVVLQDWPYALARIAFSFTIGVLLRKSQPHWLSRVPQVHMTWLLIACLGLLATDVAGTRRVIYDLAFVSVASPLMVMLGAACRIGPRVAGLSAWLGLISYPLYAVHAPVKHVAVALLPTGFVAAPVLIAATAIGIAWGMARIDPSLRRWLATQLSRTFPRQVVPLPVPRRPSRSA